MYFLTDGTDFELIDKSDKQISKISNPMDLLNPPDKGLIKIELQDYLIDIDGYALIKTKASFIKKLEEIDFSWNFV